MSYIYCITNNTNGKQYVGKTTNLVEERWREHCSDYIKDRCNKRPLYNAMNKYGIDNFTISTLEECTELDSELREIFWIESLKTYGKGYNATLGGDGSILYNYRELADSYESGLTGKDVA